MKSRFPLRAGLWVLAAALAGCRPALPTTPHTGAEEAARDYYEAIRGRDWGRAYGLLHPDSRRRWPADGFARRAEDYRRRIGFEPDAVFVRSCEEQGEQAKAHVVFEGQSGGKRRQFKDGTELRRSASGWGMVLPQQFGRAR
jgi:hypothetical protein